MITGVKTDHKMDVSAEIDSLKKYFGISSHYLEELLDGRASMKDNDFWSYFKVIKIKFYIKIENCVSCSPI